MYCGNDVVAYTHPRCINKHLNVAFLHKVFNTTEQQYILQQNATYQNIALWCLWSLKESAYKLSCFNGNRNTYNTNAYIVQVISPIVSGNIIHTVHNNSTLPTTAYINSVIMYNHTPYYGSTLITPKYIHSTVHSTPNAHNTIWAVQDHALSNKNDFSVAVRAFAIAQLAQHNVHVTSIHKDADGIPYVTLHNGTSKYISLSHDMEFAAFAYTV